MTDAFGERDEEQAGRPPWLSILVGSLSLIVGVLTVGAVVLSILAYSQALTDIHEIESSRKASILLSCEEQNTRNAHTVAALDHLLAVAVREHPASAQQVAASRASTLLLIDALAPVENCNARVIRFTKH